MCGSSSLSYNDGILMAIDLRSVDLEIVLEVLRDFVPEFEVRAFGSRVRGTARRTSDLDLAIMTEARLPLSRLADLREAFSESALPFKVDLVDWATTEERFRKIIEQGCEVLKPAEDPGRKPSGQSPP